MEKLFQSTISLIEKLLIGIFILLVIDVSWQVISRFIIGQSSSWTEELARFALIWLTVLGAAYLNGKQAHLSIDVFLMKLSPENQNRRKVVIEMFMMVFALVIMVIGGINLVYITLHLGQTSAALQVPLGFVYSIVPISGCFIIFFSLRHMLSHQQQNQSTS
jgi:TRAP-type C4-dicarboxylate transport system permease small subunit